MKNTYVDSLQQLFKENVSPENAGPMARYMKNKFEFLGIKKPERKLLESRFYKTNGLPQPDRFVETIHQLWELPHREYQYFAQELARKMIKKVSKEHIELFEYMIITRSWWDTVDFIASNLVGSLFLKYPELIIPHTGAWMESGDMWLQRTALLFQLKYKNKTDFKLLTQYIDLCKSSSEFFIQKAIGWALREYSKTNPKTVIRFVETHSLPPLSYRESLKWLKNQNRLPEK